MPFRMAMSVQLAMKSHEKAHSVRPVLLLKSTSPVTMRSCWPFRFTTYTMLPRLCPGDKMHLEMRGG